MDTTYTEKFAKGRRIEGVDHKYYGIYEEFPSGKVSCVGILQHYCGASTYSRMLMDAHRQYEVADRPKILIEELDGLPIVKYMLLNLKKKFIQ